MIIFNAQNVAMWINTLEVLEINTSKDVSICGKLRKVTKGVGKLAPAKMCQSAEKYEK